MQTKLIFGIVFIMVFSSCQLNQNDLLIKFCQGEIDEHGVPCGYLNSKGDTLIPMGMYSYCYTDTIRTMGMVIEKGTGKIIGIDQHAQKLFEVFNYDNGPDYVRSGLFRIKKNGKIGYANEQGEIIIEPRFECAYPFKGKFARVSDNCSTITNGEHSVWVSNSWYQITKNGMRVN